MAGDEKVFKAPEQKLAEEKPVEAQKEEEEKRGHEHERKEKPEAKAAEKPKKQIVLERVVTVSLGDAFKKPLSGRASYAVRLLRSQVSRGFKVDARKVKISPAVSAKIFGRGSRHPPKTLKLSCAKDKDGVVAVEAA